MSMIRAVKYSNFRTYCCIEFVVLLAFFKNGVVSDMSGSIESGLESSIFKSRWLLAPFYIGLIVGIVLLLVKFLQELLHLAYGIFSMPEQDVVIGILSLVDMSLIGSLLLMIIFNGYEIFVSKIHFNSHEDRPDWMGKVDFSGLKLKLIGAIVAISAIDLLKTFMNLPSEMSDSQFDGAVIKVVIHLTFVVSGVLFAVMDKVAGDTHKDH